MNLVDIELIKQLKGRYFRHLDCNEWDALKACLSDDIDASYSDGELSFTGSDAVIEFLSSAMSGAQMLSMHTGHTPEITLTSEGTATGIWYLNDLVMLPEHSLRITGTGIYHDEYKKVDGQWLISATGYERIFEVHEALDDSFSVAKSRFTV